MSVIIFRHPERMFVFIRGYVCFTALLVVTGTCPVIAVFLIVSPGVCIAAEQQHTLPPSVS